MKKTVLFFLLAPYAEWEAAYLASALAMLGQGAFEAKTVALTKEPVASIGGFCTLPDYDLQTLPEAYAALVLVGGMSWREEEAKRVLPAVQACLKAGRVLGGICDGAGFLAAHGFLNQVEHTGNGLEELERWPGTAYTGAALYQPQQAVRDGQVVTANGTAALEFAREMLLALQAAPEEKIEEWFQFHKKGFCLAPLPQM